MTWTLNIISAIRNIKGDFDLNRHKIPTCVIQGENVNSNFESIIETLAQCKLKSKEDLDENEVKKVKVIFLLSNIICSVLCKIPL